MSAITAYLARLIGLSTIVLVGAFMMRGSSPITATVADSPVMLVYAVFSLAAGLAIVLGHNVWSGGALPVIVSLVGWLILAKGLLLLLVDHETLVVLVEWMKYDQKYLFYLSLSLVLGLYLTYAGFTASSSKL